MGDIENLRPVSWLRDLFTDASAESMYRWVLVAWLVVVVAIVALDRLGGSLLGRTRPIVQHPPERARAWRWGRNTPPPNYSPLPLGTIDPGLAKSAELQESVREDSMYALEPGSPLERSRPLLAEMPWLDNSDYWVAIADHTSPVFGVENNARLTEGLAPERFNPVTGRVEKLDRNPNTGGLSWPDTAAAGTLRLGGTPFDDSDALR